ncbi:MAG: U32 family peptidase, partial [Clostridia bacterium]|nr:U32 family peptidase [Clostridia bacterium]
EAIARAHAYGTKVYIAANTLVYDKEMTAFLHSAEQSYLAGADAFIVADLGAAAQLRKYIPDVELHASTQRSGHSLAAARELAELGFSRMVLARELSREDIAHFTKNSPIEAEVFVHGALCVCHSGQCLFSSVVGGRSGNRGECAQPCRLPYKTDKRSAYPLSLKDLSLAAHVKELSDMGVASFKIEGRMKSPEYVRETAAIWRRIIDEDRSADRYELEELARIFSRGGYTDGYYEKKIDSSMLGVRSDEDKRISRELPAFTGIKRKIPISLSVRFKRGEPVSLTAEPSGITVLGEIPEEAKTAPFDEAALKKSLTKFGGTPFEVVEFSAELDEGLMLPVSKLNALRRALTEKLGGENKSPREVGALPERAKPNGRRVAKRTALFLNPTAITPSAREFFDIIYQPLESFDGTTDGVLFPAVIFDTQLDRARALCRRAAELGARHALIGNIGHISLAREFGFELHGDMRLNASNSDSVAELEALGFSDVVLSPELTLARVRDIGGKSAAIVYGRLPLMVTEKCVGKELADCKACGVGKVTLTDRRGVSFPVLREWEHRSLILNSLPTFMADKESSLRGAGISMRHFIFSTETPREVDGIIEKYKLGKPSDTPVRRMN